MLSPVPTTPVPTLPALQATAGTTEDGIVTTQPTLPLGIGPAGQTGGDPQATLHESGAESRKHRGEAGLITDSQHRGD